MAFVVTTLSEERDEYLSTIWVVDADGGERAPASRGAAAGHGAPLVAGRARLAFVSEREKKKGQLYVMPADGGEPGG